MLKDWGLKFGRFHLFGPNVRKNWVVKVKKCEQEWIYPAMFALPHRVSCAELVLRMHATLSFKICDLSWHSQGALTWVPMHAQHVRLIIGWPKKREYLEFSSCLCEHGCVRQASLYRQNVKKKFVVIGSTESSRLFAESLHQKSKN